MPSDSKLSLSSSPVMSRSMADNGRKEPLIGLFSSAEVAEAGGAGCAGRRGGGEEREGEDEFLLKPLPRAGGCSPDGQMVPVVQFSFHPAPRCTPEDQGMDLRLGVDFGWGRGGVSVSK